jgi:hypothetical protein
LPLRTDLAARQGHGFKHLLESKNWLSVSFLCTPGSLLFVDRSHRLFAGRIRDAHDYPCLQCEARCVNLIAHPVSQLLVEQAGIFLDDRQDSGVSRVAEYDMLMRPIPGESDMLRLGREHPARRSAINPSQDNEAAHRAADPELFERAYPHEPHENSPKQECIWFECIWSSGASHGTNQGQQSLIVSGVQTCTSLLSEKWWKAFKFNKKVARLKGFEPPTSGSGDQRKLAILL